MDRRRFTPRGEGLDARLLLSAGVRARAVPAANLQQKAIRIENLDRVLRSLEPSRTLPEGVVPALQRDLRAIVGKLGPADPRTLTAAMLQFRSTLTHASISIEDAAGLRSTFRAVLVSAGAAPETVDGFAESLERLVQADTSSDEPARLAANDYAVVLQTVLGVGRPIRPPAAPAILPSDDDGMKGDRATTVVQPRLTGRYDSASTISLLDEAGTVIGTTTVTGGGQYVVSPAMPLAPGRYKFRIRAVDPNGNTSSPSRAVAITIKTPRMRTRTTVVRTTTTGSTPAGPLRN